MVKLFVILGSVLLVGCATPDFNYRPQSVRVSEPSLGAINTSFVGDVMLRQGKYTNHDAIYLSSLVRVTWAYDLLPGFYIKKGEDAKTETFLPGGPEAETCKRQRWLIRGQQS